MTVSGSYVRTGTTEWKVADYQMHAQPDRTGQIASWIGRVVVPAIVHPAPSIGDSIFVHAETKEPGGTVMLFGLASLVRLKRAGTDTSLWFHREGDFERQGIGIPKPKQDQSITGWCDG